MKPLFISFEGGEGSGKTTQIKSFEKWVQDNYGDCVVTREPGGVGISEQIREILLNPENKKIIGMTELFLYEAARTQFVYELVKPHLEGNTSVISDRFFDSTTAYQGYAREIDTRFIDYLNYSATQGLTPDLTYLLDIPVDVGLKRAGKRDKFDRLDSESREFHEKVRNGFLQIAEENPSRVVVVNAEQSLEEVSKDIINIFSERYL